MPLFPSHNPTSSPGPKTPRFQRGCDNPLAQTPFRETFPGSNHPLYKKGMDPPCPHGFSPFPAPFNKSLTKINPLPFGFPINVSKRGCPVQLSSTTIKPFSQPPLTVFKLSFYPYPKPLYLVSLFLKIIYNKIFIFKPLLVAMF